MQQHAKRLLLTILVFCLGALSGVFGYAVVNAQAEDKVFRLDDEYSSSYSYIRPLLMCGLSEEDESARLADLEMDVTDAIQEYGNAGITVSVYFRELRSNSWFGVNEEEEYSPASLWKLPLMMTYLKLEEMESDVFENDFYYAEDLGLNDYQNYIPEEAIAVGNAYSTDDLLEKMIVYSDNNAAGLLEQRLIETGDLWYLVYNDIGLRIPIHIEPMTEFISPKAYSYFFRVLYNSTYLTDANSEKALELLSRDRFEDGIAASVPVEIPVSQKFGERKLVVGDEVLETELHDCGIVYFPKDPYILCVMTKGDAEFEQLSAIIQHVSQVVYGAVEENNGWLGFF